MVIFQWIEISYLKTLSSPKERQYVNPTKLNIVVGNVEDLNINYSKIHMLYLSLPKLQVYSKKL